MVAHGGLAARGRFVSTVVLAVFAAGCMNAIDFSAKPGGKGHGATNADRGAATEKYLLTALAVVDEKQAGFKGRAGTDDLRRWARQMEEIDSGDADPEAVSAIFEGAALLRKAGDDLDAALKTSNPHESARQAEDRTVQELNAWSRKIEQLVHRLEQRYGRKF